MNNEEMRPCVIKGQSCTVPELEDKHWNECRQIALYDDENRKLKRLLKLAMEEHIVRCNACVYSGECVDSYDCALDRTWRHAAEARALLGEDTP